MIVVPSKVVNSLCYLAHEVIGVIGPSKAGDTFSAWSKKGGQKSLFVKVSRKRKSSCTIPDQDSSLTKHYNALMKKIGELVFVEQKGKS